MAWPFRLLIWAAALALLPAAAPADPLAEALGLPVASDLTGADVDALVAAAIARWTATGLSAAQRSLLDGVLFTIEDLPGWYLGEAGDGVVTLASRCG